MDFLKERKISFPYYNQQRIVKWCDVTENEVKLSHTINGKTVYHTLSKKACTLFDIKLNGRITATKSKLTQE